MLITQKEGEDEEEEEEEPCGASSGLLLLNTDWFRHKRWAGLRQGGVTQAFGGVGHPWQAPSTNKGTSITWSRQPHKHHRAKYSDWTAEKNKPTQRNKTAADRKHDAERTTARSHDRQRVNEKLSGSEVRGQEERTCWRT